MNRPPVPDLPPDLPPEYAEAYRRGFERAYREATGDPAAADRLEQLAHAEGEAEVDLERTTRIEGLEGLFAATPAAPGSVPPGPGARGPGEYEAPWEPVLDRREPADRPTWLVPAVLAGLVAVLVAGAYLAGLVFSSSVEETAGEVEEPDGVVIGDGGSGEPGSGEIGPGETSPGEDETDGPAAGDGAYRGRVDTVPITAAEASCIAPASVDSAGNEVTYEPALSHDGDLTTAWRCPGPGSGETITFQLSRELRVAEVGLVPGYAKTDPRSGADRYAENNRLTLVRWTFPDGTSIEQELDGSADNRELQTIRIDPVLADQVVLEVLSSTPGDRRNTIAVSEIAVGTPAG